MIEKKKLLLMIVLILTPCLSLLAGDNLVIHLKSGGKAVFALVEKPVITFEGENLLVKSETANYSIPISDIDTYDFTETTEVGQVKEKVNKPVIANGHVFFSQLKAGSKVTVYAIDGRQLHYYIADSSGNVDVDLTTLPKGIYILNSPDTNIKITNR